MDVTPHNYAGLQEAACVKFNYLVDLPEHSLCKLFAELSLLKTNCYSLVPILNAEVNTNPQGRPRANQLKQGAPSDKGRWKSDFEIAGNNKKPCMNKCSYLSQPGHRITT